MRAGNLCRWIGDGWNAIARATSRAVRWLLVPVDFVFEYALGHDGEIERPWLIEPWRIAPVRGGFASSALARARARGAEVARLTLGEETWNQLRAQGYLDVRSKYIPGLTYRLRVGRRVQLLWETPEAARRMRWPYRGYLCINPTYPLPAVEFAAHLYLYLRDQEEKVIRVAAPQAADDAIRFVY